jgi:hypothetical protein
MILCTAGPSGTPVRQFGGCGYGGRRRSVITVARRQIVHIVLYWKVFWL